MQHTALKPTCQPNELSVEKSSASVEKVDVSSASAEKVYRRQRSVCDVLPNCVAMAVTTQA